MHHYIFLGFRALSNFEMNRNVADQQVTFRCMGYEDIDKLITTCQMSFPDSLMWASPYSYANRWWSTILETRSCEAWISLLGEEIIGFILLIIDTREWRKVKKLQLKMKLREILSVFKSSPIRFAIRVVKKLFSKKDSEVTFLHYINGTAPAPLWIDLIAVTPQMQRKGIGMKLVEFSKQRAAQLGRKQIMLLVNVNDTPALELYKKSGFNRVHST